MAEGGLAVATLDALYPVVDHHRGGRVDCDTGRGGYLHASGSTQIAGNDVQAHKRVTMTRVSYNSRGNEVAEEAPGTASARRRPGPRS
jgi:hypothetical protein